MGSHTGSLAHWEDSGEVPQTLLVLLGEPSHLLHAAPSFGGRHLRAEASVVRETLSWILCLDFFLGGVSKNNAIRTKSSFGHLDKNV